MSDFVAPTPPLDEEDRLSVLRALGALDSPPDPRFDRIVRLTATLLHAPRAAIVLVDEDRLWHKASLGIPRQQYDRAGTLADIMIGRNELAISCDIAADPRFAGDLAGLTQVDVRFYACAPLMTPEGATVGLLVAGDPEPHPPPTEAQLTGLKDLADMAVAELLRDAERITAARTRRLDRQRGDLALEAAGLGEFEWDMSADRFYISERMKELVGVGQSSTAALKGDLSFRFVHPEDREPLRLAVEESLRTEGRYRNEYRILRPDGEIRWMMGAGVLVTADDGTPRKIIGVVQDITERKRNEEQRETLLSELDHRVKNVLAAVQSLAAQSARGSEGAEAFVARFEGRLRAMAHAHELLTATRWRGATLEGIVSAELAGLAGTRAVFSGPDLFLTPRAANAVALAVHELATNAVKYGALSTEGGRVLMDWRKNDDGGFSIDWVETGGPMVSPPTRRGFGTVLLERVTGRELGGSSRLVYEPGGLKVSITADRSALTAPAEASETAATTSVPLPPAPEEGSGVEGLRLLIVEDATLLALELEAGLTEAGARIVGAAGELEEALALSEGDIDAAVLDVNLNGRLVTPVAERLASRGIPFVLATGYGETGAPGGFGAPIVRKPYNILQIIRAVSEAVGRT